jgi:hypothetical protein
MRERERSPTHGEALSYRAFLKGFTARVSLHGSRAATTIFSLPATAKPR